MAWVEPTVPVSGTVITVAWATSSVVNSQIWLRTMTGGADPPAADRIIRSTSTTATTWGQVTANCIADGHVQDAKLTNQKVNAFTLTAGSFANLLGANLNGFWEIGLAPDGPVASQSWYALNHLEFQFPATYAWQTAVNIADQNEIYTRIVIAGTPGAWRKMWHSGNDGAGSGLDADLLDGQSSAFYATASSVAAIAAVPSGLIAAFATAGAIAAGWTRFTSGNGRFLIGAGTSFSQTFVEGASAGSSWTHLHGTTGTTVQSGSGASAAAAANTADATWIPPSFTVVHAQKS